jgi:hypothetical protein
MVGVILQWFLSISIIDTGATSNSVSNKSVQVTITNYIRVSLSLQKEIQSFSNIITELKQ